MKPELLAIIITVIIIAATTVIIFNFDLKPKKVEASRINGLNFKSQSIGNSFIRHENKEVICYYKFAGYGAGLSCKFKENNRKLRIEK